MLHSLPSVEPRRYNLGHPTASPPRLPSSSPAVGLAGCGLTSSTHHLFLPPSSGGSSSSRKRPRKKASLARERARAQALGSGIDLESSGEFASVEKMLATTDTNKFSTYLQTTRATGETPARRGETDGRGGRETRGGTDE